MRNGSVKHFKEIVLIKSEEKIEYVQGTNLMPGWNQGYVILDHGRPELVSPLFLKDT